MLRGFLAQVEADFFLVGFVADGAVLVQCASPMPETAPPNDPPSGRPRVFVVKGLATPWEQMLPKDALQRAAAAAAGGSAEGGADAAALPRFRTVLVPLRGALTYVSTLSALVTPYRTPKALDEVVASARGAYARALDDPEAFGPVYRTLDAV